MDPDRAKQMFDEGVRLSDLGRFSEAFEQFDGALPLARQYGFPNQVAQCLMNSASCLRLFGRREVALERYEEALPLFREHGRPEQVAQCLTNSASCLNDLGRREAALERYEETLTLYRQHGSLEQVAHCLMSSANCLYEFGRREGALERYEEALTSFQQHGSLELLAYCLMNSAVCLNDLGRWEAALERFDEAEAALVSLGPEADEIRYFLVHNRASLVERLGDLLAARAHLAHAIALAEGLSAGLIEAELRRDYRATLLDAFQDSARLALNPSDPQPADAFVTVQRAKGRTLSELLARHADPDPVARLELLITQELEQQPTGEEAEVRRTALRRLRRRRLAERRQLRGTDPREPLPLNNVLEALRPGEALLDAFEVRDDGTLALFLLRPGLTAEPGGIDWAGLIDGSALVLLFSAWEASREPLVADLRAGIRPTGDVVGDYALVETEALAPIGELLLGPLQPLLTDPKHPVTTLIISPSGLLHRLPFAALPVPWLAGTDEMHAGTDTLLDQYALQLVPTATSLAILRSRAGSANWTTWPLALLAAAPFADLIADSQDGQNGTESRPHQQAADRSNPLRGALTKRRDGRRTRSGATPSGPRRALTRLWEVIRGGGWSGALPEVPLGAKPVSVGRAAELDGSLAQSRSTTILGPVSDLPAEPVVPLLRDIVERADAQRALPGSGREVTAIAELLGQPVDRDHPLLGPRATRAAVLCGLPAARLVHLSTHGQKLGPDQSVLDYRLLLADGEAVTVQEVYEGVVSLEDVVLVCLSACVLGQVVQRGAEAMGFTQAFLQAGAGVVMAPIWAVEDGATAELMVGWYRTMLGEGEMGEGRPGMAEAWRAAVRELRQAHGGVYDHPYYWAGFLPAGDGSLTLGAAPTV